MKPNRANKAGSQKNVYGPYLIKFIGGKCFNSIFNIMTYTDFKYINQLYWKETVDTGDAIKIQVTHGEMSWARVEGIQREKIAILILNYDVKS